MQFKDADFCLLLFGYILLLYGVQFQLFKDVDFCCCCHCYFVYFCIVSNLNSLKTLMFFAIVGLFWYLHNLFALIQLYK